MMRRHSFVVVVLISLLSLLVSCTHNSPPTPSPIENTFNGIIALSATNVWAVGGMTASDGMHVLIEHWDGNRWQANSPSIHGILCSVVALSAKDMWAVGEDIYLGSCNGTGIARHANDTLTLHWDGKTWSRIPVPALETISNYLDSVSAISSRDVWSVGNVRSYNGAVIIHWDGKNWNVVLQPHAFPFQIARLTSVKAISSSDVWIVGEYTAPEGGGTRTLVEHWDGKDWRFVSTPDRTQDQRNVADATFHGLATFAPKNLLAVGRADLIDASSHEQSGALVEQWNGSRWDVIYPPLSVNQQMANLQDVTFLTPHNAWAVGESSTGPSSGLMMLHWDGKNWLVIDLPTGGAMWSYLNAMDAIVANDIWAVGRTSFSYPVSKTLVEHWDGTRWRIIPSPNPGTPGPIVGEP